MHRTIASQWLQASCYTPSCSLDCGTTKQIWSGGALQVFEVKHEQTAEIPEGFCWADILNRCKCMHMHVEVCQGSNYALHHAVACTINCILLAIILPGSATQQVYFLTTNIMELKIRLN